MIHLSFCVSNPWGHNFQTLWNKSGNLSKYKSWEVELLKTRELIGFSIGYTMRQDHAGLNADIGLFGYNISFQVYDTRHWDSKNNCYEIDE